jgi:aldehyde:ferredoxin oxidoreductase
MLEEYYQFRGWDENGVPKPEKLAELQLDNLVSD